MGIPLLAVQFLFSSGLIVSILRMHCASYIISIQLSFQRQLVRKEQELTTVFVVQEFSIQGVYYMQHVVLEVVDGFQSTLIATRAIRKLSCKEFWKNMRILPGNFRETCILSELLRYLIHGLTMSIEQVTFM